MSVTLRDAQSKQVELPPQHRFMSLGTQRGEPIQGFGENLGSFAVGPAQGLVAHAFVIAQGLLRNGDHASPAREVSGRGQRVRIVRHRAEISGEEVGAL